VFLAGAIDLADTPAGTFLIIDYREGAGLAIGLLSILLAHEMGHYLACRYYRVDATLPQFLPSPWIPAFGWLVWQPISFVGTFGAFIRIRGRIPHRKALFDIGVAGPLAGFVVCLPVLVLGIAQGRILPRHAPGLGIEFGEPLLFQWITQLVHGPVPDGYELVIGKLGVAAWFGLFVTALNLMPIGQLDGGHVTYSLLRERAHLVSRLAKWACIGLIWFGPNWLLWAVIARFVGRPHPPTSDDEAPAGAARAWVGGLALLVFVVCFVPNPIVASWDSVRSFLEPFVPWLRR
jgi:membrane-associated protease RseP (regulator of RpoE activity)